MGHESIDLSIIVVSFNTRELTEACLQSIFREVHKRTITTEVIVIDNASTDGSLELLQQHFPGVKLLAQTSNVGFAAANNLGVAHARGRYVLFLNSDTEVHEGALEELYTQAVAAGASIASCKLVNPDGSIQPQGGFLPTLTRVAWWMLFLDDVPPFSWMVRPYHMERTTFFENDRTLGWLGGTALLFEKASFLRLKGFDENVFMYAEDVELCLRARMQGLRVYYFSKPSIMHVGHGSGSTMKARLGEIAGLVYLYAKHYPGWRLSLLRRLLVAGSYLRWLVFGMILGDGERKQIYATAIGVARQ